LSTTTMVGTGTRTGTDPRKHTRHVIHHVLVSPLLISMSSYEVNTLATSSITFRPSLCKIKRHRRQCGALYTCHVINHDLDPPLLSKQPSDDVRRILLWSLRRVVIRFNMVPVQQTYVGVRTHVRFLNFASSKKVCSRGSGSWDETGELRAVVLWQGTHHALNSLAPVSA
jgi:hypothetical protein